MVGIYRPAAACTFPEDLIPGFEECQLPDELVAAAAQRGREDEQGLEKPSHGRIGRELASQFALNDLRKCSRTSRNTSPCPCECRREYGCTLAVRKGTHDAHAFSTQTL